MTVLHCRICGEAKPREAFSTAYKNTCKDCRNKQVRDERAIAKQVLAKKEEELFPKTDWGKRLFEASVSIHAARINAYAVANKRAVPDSATSVRMARELCEDLMNLMP